MRKGDPRDVITKVCVACISSVVIFNAIVMTSDSDNVETLFIDSGKVFDYHNVYNVELVDKTPKSAASEDSSDEVVDTPDRPSDMPTHTDHNHIAWLQFNYKDAAKDRIVGKKTIGSSGCGWCSLSAAMAYLNPTDCSNMDPRSWIPILADKIGTHWRGNGMGSGGPEAWVREVNALGGYGEYQVVETNKAYSVNTKYYIDVLEKYLDEDNTVVVLSCSPTLFTSEGHIIVALDLVREGDNVYVHIADSSNTAVKHLFTRNDWPKMSSFNFPIKEGDQYITSYGGYSYSWKACWVIRRVR